MVQKGRLFSFVLAPSRRVGSKKFCLVYYSVLLEHQAPIILHYYTLMAANTNVLKSQGAAPVTSHDCEVEVEPPARSLRSLLQGWGKKRWWGGGGGDDGKVQPTRLDPHVRHGRAYILCHRGKGYFPPKTFFFPSSSIFKSQNALLFLRKSSCPYPGCWCFGIKAGWTRTSCRYLHHHSPPFASRCSARRLAKTHRQRFSSSSVVLQGCIWKINTGNTPERHAGNEAKQRKTRQQTI